MWFGCCLNMEKKFLVSVLNFLKYLKIFLTTLPFSSQHIKGHGVWNHGNLDLDTSAVTEPCWDFRQILLCSRQSRNVGFLP